MANRSTFPLVDRLLEGTLADTLIAWDDEDVKPEEMAFRLRSEHGVRLSSSTVRRWVEKAKAGELPEEAA